MNQSKCALLLALSCLFLQTEAVEVDEVHHISGTGWARASNIPIVVPENNDAEEEEDEKDGGTTFLSMHPTELRRSILVGFDSPEKEADFVRKTKQQRSGGAVVQHEYHYTKTVRMEVSEDEYHSMLQAHNGEGSDQDDSGILYIEEDVKVLAASPKPKSQSRQNLLRQEQGKEEPVQRKLQERVSYGLDMVQGFDYIPPAREAPSCFVKICIVDSGLHVGHYDIPYSRGTPYVDGEEFGLPSNQYWYNPNEGTDHGTAIAGIITARGGNGAGTLGIVSQGPEASKVCLLNARILR